MHGCDGTEGGHVQVDEQDAGEARQLWGTRGSFARVAAMSLRSNKQGWGSYGDGEAERERRWDICRRIRDMQIGGEWRLIGHKRGT